MLEKYVSQLNTVTEKINSYFEEQHEYIKCQAGCGLCCSMGYYPVSELEYQYVRKGIETLYSKEQIELLHEKSWKIYKEMMAFYKKTKDIHSFVYSCPLNENDQCSIYEYRPILCRAYGLVMKDSEYPEEKRHMPKCMSLGLNYANVWDYENNIFSTDKIRALRLKTIPQSYDVSYGKLIESFEDVHFGDTRMLYEWIIMDIPDYQEKMKNP